MGKELAGVQKSADQPVGMLRATLGPGGPARPGLKIFGPQHPYQPVSELFSELVIKDFL